MVPIRIRQIGKVTKRFASNRKGKENLLDPIQNKFLYDSLANLRFHLPDNPSYKILQWN